MTRLTLVCLTAVLAAANALAQTMGQATTAAATSRAAAGQADADKASQTAGALFDGTAAGGAVSPPPVLVPVKSERQPSADLIVGTPGKDHIKEPKSPLTPDGKAKEAKSSGGVWWTLGGAVAGAGIGFLLGGPIGAAIGAVALGLLAFFLRP
ncbi:hypothetical protein EPO15_09450 [bacterium]|nr:MAG: hypothetical protein EPO15_09450 [bacterium]